MQIRLSSDQTFFRETTAKFLSDVVPVEVIRRLRDDAAGFDPTYWRRGAELGWTSLLVDETLGGGSISGDGVLDLAIVAYEFGQTAAPGPLGSANVVASALSESGTHKDVLAGLLDGSVLATSCFSSARSAASDNSLTIHADGDELLLNGSRQPVESAAQASHLLITASSPDGLTQVLVPTSTPGVSISALQTVDLTRRFSAVTFEQVRVSKTALVGEVGAAGPAVERQLQQALVVSNAESVGAIQAAFDMTVQWAFDRYSFGRPLAAYQALKHRFADMLSWVEAAHAIADEAAVAVAENSPKAASLVSAAKAFIGDYGGELMHECVQLHGGIGVTFEHDLHLFLRRQTVNRALLGTPAEHRQRLTDLHEQRES